MAKKKIKTTTLSRIISKGEKWIRKEQKQQEILEEWRGEKRKKKKEVEEDKEVKEIKEVVEHEVEVGKEEEVEDKEDRRSLERERKRVFSGAWRYEMRR